MVYPHMLPSKGPTSQSAFLLPPASSNHQAQTMQQQQSITSNTSPGPSHASIREEGVEEETAEVRGDAASPMTLDRLSQASQQEDSTALRSPQPSATSAGANTSTAAHSGPPIHKGVERYKPRIFGFPVHEVAVLHRWQEQVAETLGTGQGARRETTTSN